MFNKQIDYYKRKINEVKEKVNDKTLSITAKMLNFDLEKLEDEFKNNSVEFKKFAYSVAKSLSKGAVKSEVYCGVIIYFAEKYEMNYKLYAGFCLPEDHPKYKDEVKKVEDLKAEGKEHPCVATHTYVEIDDKTYELFNNSFSGIGHIDVVEL